MTSADNIEFLKQENRRYIIGTPKSMLKKYERELLKDDWSRVRDGLEVKRCQDPEAKSDETFILCRSSDRAQKERAMHDRFEKRIEEGLGDEPRKVLDEIAQIAVVDVVLPTKAGPDLLKRCIAQASEHQNVLLHRLKLHLPSHLETLSV